MDIDPERTTNEIVSWMLQIVRRKLNKKGVVIGISGGIDSSVCLALGVKAFGPDKVFAIAMPESESNPDSTDLARNLAEKYGIEFVVEDMTAALSGLKAYQRRDEAIRSIFPEYDSTCKVKIVLPGDLLEKGTLNIFQLSIIAADGSEKSKRIPLKEYLQIVAASNFKQRSRMAMLYYHAERLNYAVIGTGNKNEHDQGFFVKYGDGGADVKPIAHLYKNQIYQLGEYLDIPDEIRERIPTTDTYSAECTQEEFFFRVPFEIGDFVLFGLEENIPVSEIAGALSLKEEQVIRIQNDIKQKIKTCEYLKAPPYHVK